jgi:hypothetical protein
MSKSENEYRKLLAGHDWYYNFSDDYSVWAKGKRRSGDIFALQPDVDPDFTIYNEHAPKDMQIAKK